MLESLGHDTATIHELNLDGAFPARAPYRPRELYEALKRTPLFDAERGQWNKAMNEAQILQRTSRHAGTQLLGVLVEAQFNPDGARGLFETLRMSALYDPERRQWNDLMSEGQKLLATSRQADVQLLGVLVEGQFNPEGVRPLYEQLKATSLYDLERGQWNKSMFKEQDLGDTHRCADVQLLGALVEAQFNPAGARLLYEQLKAALLFDPVRERWNWDMSMAQQLGEDASVYADVQLLGVLAAAQFNPENARGLYEALKATPLYDAERGQWNWGMSEKEILEETERHAEAQLLGVLVEAKLLSTLPRRLAEAVPPLPLMENW